MRDLRHYHSETEKPMFADNREARKDLLHTKKTGAFTPALSPKQSYGSTSPTYSTKQHLLHPSTLR